MFVVFGGVGRCIAAIAAVIPDAFGFVAAVFVVVVAAAIADLLFRYINYQNLQLLGLPAIGRPLGMALII